ncbi:MAG: hypothetical protein R2813_12370 [Flavobacteriales bacterium]
MKNFLAFIIAALSLAGCQKGEDDPFLSLSTRKSRISGNWTVESFTITTSGVTQTFDGTEVTYALGDSLSDGHTYSWEWSFDRHGSYTSVTTEDFPEDTANKAMSYTETNTVKGEWEFTGGNNSPSKSELLLLPNYTESQRSDQGSNISAVNIDNPINGMVYQIKKLSADEMVLTIDQTVSTAFGQQHESAEINFKKKK